MCVAHCTAWPPCIQFGGATSVVFCALHAAVLYDPASFAYYKHQPCGSTEYKDASAVVKLRVVGKRCHTLCTPWTMHGIAHVALSHCAFSTSLVDFHTLCDQPLGPSARTFLGYMPVCMIRNEILMHAYLAKSCEAKYMVV